MSIKPYKPSDEADHIEDWLYLPETLYAFMCVTVWTGAGTHSLGAVFVGLMNEHIA